MQDDIGNTRCFEHLEGTITKGVRDFWVPLGHHKPDAQSLTISQCLLIKGGKVVTFGGHEKSARGDRSRQSFSCELKIGCRVIRGDARKLALGSTLVPQLQVHQSAFVEGNGGQVIFTQ